MDLKTQIKGELIKQKEEELIKRKEANSKIEEFILYVDNRPLSINTKKFLNDEGFKYIEKDITEDQELMTKVTSITNMNSFPTALINGNYLVYRRDFQNPKQLGGAIQYFGNGFYKQPTLEEGLVEQLKTANYNLGQRMQRIEQMIAPVSRIMNQLAEEDKEEKTKSNAKKNK